MSEFQISESVECGFLKNPRCTGDLGDPSFFEGLFHLVLDIFLEAPDEKPFDIFPGVVLGIGDGGWVQHVHEAGKASRLAVVRRSGKHDESVRALSQKLGQFGAQGGAAAPLGNVMGFVDDNDVPVCVFEIGAIFGVLLEGIDGDDRPVVIVKRVLIGGDAGADALDAD